MKLALGVSRFIPSSYVLINFLTRQGVPLAVSGAHPIGVCSFCSPEMIKHFVKPIAETNAAVSDGFWRV